MVELCIEPGRVVRWQEFVDESSQQDIGSIALDGYVYGPTRYARVKGASGEVIGVQNFNHHEEVDRLSTYATCQQVDIGLKNQMADAFRDLQGRFRARVCLNDADQDVCTAVWLLENKSRVRGSGDPIINRLVSVEGLMDMTAGMYPFDVDTPFLETMNWVYLPYAQARLSGEATSRDPRVIERIIRDVGGRITAYSLGRAESVPLDTQGYTVLDKGEGWTMIRETSPQGRMGALQDGHDALVVVRDQNPNRLDVSVCKRSDWVPFPSKRAMRALNIAEGTLKANDRWSGATTAWGSPRSSGTKLGIEGVSEVLRDVT